MSIFQIRTDYFKGLANKNKLIGHDRFLSGSAGPKRKSFHRINDEEEINAACINWAHFPCMVHFGFSGKYSEKENEVKKRLVLNDLIILDKVKAPTDMASIQEKRDSTFSLMEDIIAHMLEQFEEDQYCSPFQNLDLSLFSFSEYGPLNSTLYGWRLSFNDEQFPNNLNSSDPLKWHE